MPRLWRGEVEGRGHTPGEHIKANNRIGSDWQVRFAPLPAGYRALAGRWTMRIEQASLKAPPGLRELLIDLGGGENGSREPRCILERQPWSNISRFVAICQIRVSCGPGWCRKLSFGCLTRRVLQSVWSECATTLTTNSAGKASLGQNMSQEWTLTPFFTPSHPAGT
jgi:hypothetical protein